MENNRKKILITGAAGLIGNQLANRLSINYDVVGIDNYFRPNLELDTNNFELINVDIDSFLLKTVNNYDYIFHLAAINGTKYFYDIPNELIENNIISDINVFKFAKKNKNCKVIYASSSEIVSDSDTIPTAEETNVYIKDLHNPRWSYRISKMLSENYLVNSNIDFLIIRFFNIYGESSKSGHFIADIIEKIAKKDYKIIGANETRSFCYIDDAVNALINIFENATNEIVNIGTDEEMSIASATKIISGTLNLNVDWEFESSVAGSTVRRCPNLSKLRIFYPKYSPLTFKEGIKKALNAKSK
jgi:nucleoside-diphosphate-sugar epimerase